MSEIDVEPNVLYLKDMDWSVVLQAPDKFEADWPTKSVFLCGKIYGNSLELFDSILE